MDENREITSTHLLHFPPQTRYPRAELTTDPAMRFAGVFLTRERWKAELIKLYLSNMTVDTKDVDKILL